MDWLFSAIDPVYFVWAFWLILPFYLFAFLILLVEYPPGKKVIPALPIIYLAASFYFIHFNIPQIPLFGDRIVTLLLDVEKGRGIPLNDSQIQQISIVSSVLFTAFLLNIARAVFSVHELDKGLYGGDSRWGDHVMDSGSAFKFVELGLRFLIALAFLFLDQLLWAIGNMSRHRDPGYIVVFDIPFMEASIIASRHGDPFADYFSRWDGTIRGNVRMGGLGVYTFGVLGEGLLSESVAPVRLAWCNQYLWVCNFGVY